MLYFVTRKIFNHFNLYKDNHSENTDKVPQRYFFKRFSKNSEVNDASEFKGNLEEICSEINMLNEMVHIYEYCICNNSPKAKTCNNFILHI